MSARRGLGMAVLYLVLLFPTLSKAMDLLALPFEARIAVPPLLALSLEDTPQAWQSSWPGAYLPAAEYEGYFHHGLCYRVDAGMFVAAQEADADHYCASKLWSGNFLNWAGMSALDTLRYALTGGARAQDDQQLTVLGRADLGKQPSGSFNKSLDARQADISRLAPFDVPQVFLRACARRLQLWSKPPEHACGGRAENLLSELELRVRVCDAQDQRAWLCKSYGRVSKPEGLLQAAAPWLRIALQVRERGFTSGELIGMEAIGRDWRRVQNTRPEWDPDTGVMAAGSTVLRQVSRPPPSFKADIDQAALLETVMQPESGLVLASCQRTHVLRWPEPKAAEQDGTAQLASLRRQFARMQLDYQRASLPSQISLAMNRDHALYLASTDPHTFASTLRRYQLDTSQAGKTILPAQAKWEASLPESKQRRLLSTGSGDQAGRLIALSPPGLSASQLQALRTSPFTLRADGLLPDRLAWLRGEAGVQQGQGGKLADRRGSFASQFAGNLAWMGLASGQGLVFMSSGDGLLHALDDNTGTELFAWMPSALLTRLPATTAPDFPAQSLLDGGISVGSVLEQGRKLPVLAVAGGHSMRGVFALKLVDASRIDGSGWRALEFTAADDARLGDVLQPPHIVRIATRYGKDSDGKDSSSRPFLLFSSGVNGVAGLFLLALDLAPGTPWVEGSNYFFVPAAAGKLSPGAHLAPATVVLDDSQNLRHAWAGDEQGRMWRFSMVDAPKSTVGFAMTASLVFSATSASGEPQIISSAPRIAYGPDQSWLVLFGTGQWLEIKDAAPGAARQESFYGLLDRPATSIAIRRDALTVRKAEPSEAGFRVDGAKATSSAQGWVFDFPAKGERVTQSAVLLGGRILITTLRTPAYPCDDVTWRTWDLDAMQGTNQLQTGRAIRHSLQTPLVLRGPDASIANAFGQRAAGLVSVFNDLPAPGAQLEGSQLKDSLPVGRLAWREIHNWSRLHATQSKP